MTKRNSVIELLSFLICFACIDLQANDGMYVTSGSSIYPMQETSIAMQKEHLSFKIVDGMAYVNIYFEFYNPSAASEVLQIGFQAPSSAGDVGRAMANTSQIRDFTAAVNGDLMAYQIYAAKCEDCELMDTSATRFSQEDNGVFVYLFEAEFAPGLNQVSHSYHFPASSSVMLTESYDYILTTGSKWAQSSISDFTLDIDMGENCYFYISDIFGPSAVWSVTGVGKVSEERYPFYDLYEARMIRVLSGVLHIEVNDFAPDSNLAFGVVSSSSFSAWNIDLGESSLMVRRALLFGSVDYMAEDLTLADLRLIRNTIFAQHGYVFSSPDLVAYFSSFNWYIPNPNVKQDLIALTIEEETLLKEVVEMEKLKSKH